MSGALLIVGAGPGIGLATAERFGRGGLAVTPHASYASLGLGKAALRNVVEGLAPALRERNIRIATATVSTLVAPDSAEARGVADTLWALATDSDAGWERPYFAA